MSRTDLVVASFQARNRDRYMRRLEQPDQGELTRAQSIGVVIVCTILIVLVLVIA